MTIHATGETAGSALEPGQFVRLAGARDWGIGQVQSVVGHRVTVNFENAGKRLINLESATLTIADPSADRS
jgi:transcription elongation factor GreA-like protein